MTPKDEYPSIKNDYYAKHPNTIFLGKFCGVYTELLFNGTYFRVFYANAMVVFHW